MTKPVVAWVSGTCAKLFKSEVQFGHAGAKSGGDKESAQVSPFHMLVEVCVQLQELRMQGWGAEEGLALVFLIVFVFWAIPSSSMGR